MDINGKNRRRGYVSAANITAFRLSHHPVTPGSVPVPDRVVARFMRRLVRVNARGCIELRTARGVQRKRDAAGKYVYMRWTDRDGRQRGIGGHRLMALIERDAPLPAGTYACHQCDNPRCVSHVYVGTPTDNARDYQDMQRIIARTGRAVITIPLRRRTFACEALAA